MVISRLEGGAELETGGRGLRLRPCVGRGGALLFSADAGRAAVLPSLPSLVLILPLLIVSDNITLYQTISALE